MLYLFGHGQPCDLCNSVKALIHYILDIYSSLHPYHRLAWSICPSLAASPHSCLPELSGHWMTSFAAKVNKVNMWKVNLRTHCTDFYDLLFYSLLSSTDLAFLTSHFLKNWIHLSFSSFPVSALKNRFLSLWFTDSTSCWLSRWSRLSINVSPCAGTNSVTKMSDRILCQNATVRRGKREQKKGKPDTPSLFKNWGCLF